MRVGSGLPIAGKPRLLPGWRGSASGLDKLLPAANTCCGWRAMG
jgi:hypothetical protein